MKLKCLLGFHAWKYTLRFRYELRPGEVIPMHPLMNAFRPYDGWAYRGRRCSYCGRIG